MNARQGNLEGQEVLIGDQSTRSRPGPLVAGLDPLPHISVRYRAQEAIEEAQLKLARKLEAAGPQFRPQLILTSDGLFPARLDPYTLMYVADRGPEMGIPQVGRCDAGPGGTPGRDAKDQAQASSGAQGGAQ